MLRERGRVLIETQDHHRGLADVIVENRCAASRWQKGLDQRQLATHLVPDGVGIGYRVNGRDLDERNTGVTGGVDLADRLDSRQGQLDGVCDELLDLRRRGTEPGGDDEAVANGEARVFLARRCHEDEHAHRDQYPRCDQHDGLVIESEPGEIHCATTASSTGLIASPSAT